MPRSRRQNPWNEVIGLVALGIGTVVFLALISYNPGDVPSWVWFSYKSPPNNPTQNFIGPTGAIVAGFLYLTLGAAAYLVTSLFLGFGVAKLFLPGFRILRRLPWALLFVVSGAALTQLQPWFLRSWEQQFKLLGPGGMLGYWVGAGLLQNALGKIGSIVALMCIYLVSLVWLTGIRPVAIVKQIFSGMRALARQAATDREQKRLAAADERERLELDQRKIEREIKKQERELKKKGVSIPEEPAVPRPEPKVFDTVAAPSPPKKPSRPAPPPKPAEEVYELPGVDLFDPVEAESRKASDPAELKEIQAVLVDTLKQFNIDVAPGDITRGPTITRYEVYPARGVRVDRITSLERDLARATRAERINILAPIPGKDTVGIEIANTKKVKVALREIVESPDWAQTKMKIPIVLGKDVYGKIILGDLAQMPHCLVAGTTGSGKSVCINAVIASILLRFSPADLQFVMIDPKVVEMQMYNSLPHLKIPVVTDPKKVLLALRWVVSEMEKRYRIFAHVGVRNVSGFNARPKPKTQKQLDLEAESGRDGQTRPNVPDGTRNARDEDLIIPEKLPYIVVIIDELADLMQTAPADVESAIARITQMARAAGIHMIVATQTPRADIITGVIKANIPTRIAFQVASSLDSRVILDENGAERLLGQGDMFYRPPGTSRLVRSQGVLVTDDEIHRLVSFVSAQAQPSFDADVQNQLESSSSPEEDVTEEDEELVKRCLEIIRQEKRASTSMLQRRLRLGYTRAARVVDILERRGILGPGEGAKPREILVPLDALVGESGMDSGHLF
ncbi:MAG TPA: DNA translocase FtsK 4TM domain-containing protein, partial [Chthoniobacterales bacterium]|nr:DNA translocase FtsK 4TM domain-containing protein [Chthoniobacterales bacterium]